MKLSPLQIARYQYQPKLPGMLRNGIAEICVKNGDPTVEKVISAAKGFGDLTRFKEVVFCGFGEPTYKVAEMVALCDYFHEKGLKTRLNTNGQGNLINKRDIVPDLKG